MFFLVNVIFVFVFCTIKCGGDGVIGAIYTYPVSSIPAGFLECNGSQYKATDYPELYEVLGETYGASVIDGYIYFNTPDYRGYFLRSWDHGAGIDIDSSQRSDRGDGTTGDNIGTIQDDMFASHVHSNSKTGAQIDGSELPWPWNNNDAILVDTEPAGGNETRPKNINVIRIIYAKNVDTNAPSTNPTIYPSSNPSIIPSIIPSINPTNFPTSDNPTMNPTMNPSLNPSLNPTLYPTNIASTLSIAETLTTRNNSNINSEASIVYYQTISNGELYDITFIMAACSLLLSIISILLVIYIIACKNNNNNNNGVNNPSGRIDNEQEIQLNQLNSNSTPAAATAAFGVIGGTNNVVNSSNNNMASNMNRVVSLSMDINNNDVTKNEMKYNNVNNDTRNGNDELSQSKSKSKSNNDNNDNNGNDEAMYEEGNENDNANETMVSKGICKTSQFMKNDETK